MMLYRSLTLNAQDARKIRKHIIQNFEAASLPGQPEVRAYVILILEPKLTVYFAGRDQTSLAFRGSGWRAYRSRICCRASWYSTPLFPHHYAPKGWCLRHELDAPSTRGGPCEAAVRLGRRGFPKCEIYRSNSSTGAPTDRWAPLVAFKGATSPSPFDYGLFLYLDKFLILLTLAL